MSQPVRPAIWAALIATVLAIGVLVKLGFWQLDRAEEKRHLMAQLAQRAEQTLHWPLPDWSGERLAGYRLAGTVEPVRERTLLLDNQTLDGQVGYRWLQPARFDGGAWILLDLGFVPVARGDRTLPTLPALPERLSVSGRLYRPGHNPLNANLLPEAGSVTRIQALELAQLSRHWGEPIAPVVWLAEQPELVGFTRSWQPINLSPEKHQGYALQWFGLAVALVIILLRMIQIGRLQRSAQADRLET
ncbi:SURF1 family protein [Ferrimonas balearica]|uniref:SURF1 family protein n=1 Tax=Ferrimonas balearica TaxID=44012 RepID=UPI001F23EB18|nr:SURF1 family protein [Ferrimonas balearica]MBY6019431.1 SURF1 family protein [Halomonas denitrificans]MBY6096218.1 SURF1 family protein [Ferrimonas balearica]